MATVFHIVYLFVCWLVDGRVSYKSVCLPASYIIKGDLDLLLFVWGGFDTVSVHMNSQVCIAVLCRQRSQKDAWHLLLLLSTLFILSQGFRHYG